MQYFSEYFSFAGNILPPKHGINNPSLLHFYLCQTKSETFPYCVNCLSGKLPLFQKRAILKTIMCGLHALMGTVEMMAFPKKKP